jgi:Nif-specific regulatory protein
VKVDCAALPGSLIENELFGHEKGAFTGADTRQTGKFEAADGGTVFIDELGELPLPVQGKLLRVLQDREFDRVGGTTPVQVNVRIVAATHRDLAAMVREGKFREDLYYRIKVVEVGLPPLRARGADDLERLARHFVAQASKRHHLAAEPTLTRSALERLCAWHWPGNVRELENCIESAVVLCDGEVRVEHLPLADFKPGTAAAPVRADAPIATLAEVERAHVLAVLERAKGNRTQAAKWLGIGRNTLGRRLREYGLSADDD